MMSDTEMLDYIHKSTEMGRDGVQHIIKYAHDEEFHQALEQQLTEYAQLFDVSECMLYARGHEPAAISPAVKLSSQLMTAMKAVSDRSTSKMAEMMVQGNTMGMTKSLRYLHDYAQGDERVLDLANKLLQTEEANIEQMKKYL